MLNDEYSASEIDVVQQVLEINPMPQTLAECLRGFEAARFLKQPVETWLTQDFRVLFRIERSLINGGKD